LTGVGSVVPLPDAVGWVVSLLPIVAPEQTVTLLLFVCLPLALALAVFVRARVTKAPAGTVLAAFALPCLLWTTWTLSGYSRTSGGVSPENLVSLGAGLLLSFVVLADGVVTRLAVRERT
jgi:hypothetical protein